MPFTQQVIELHVAVLVVCILFQADAKLPRCQLKNLCQSDLGYDNLVLLWLMVGCRWKQCEIQIPPFLLPILITTFPDF